MCFLRLVRICLFLFCVNFRQLLAHLLKISSFVWRYLVYGGLFHAPLVHNWLGFLTRLFPKVIHEYIGNISTICVYFLKGCLAKHMVCITSTLTLAILPQLNKKLKLKREKCYLYSVKQQKRVPFMISLFFFSRKSQAASPVSNFVCTSYFKRDTLGWIIYLFFNYFCCPS